MDIITKTHPGTPVDTDTAADMEDMDMVRILLPLPETDIMMVELFLLPGVETTEVDTMEIMTATSLLQ